MVTLNFRDADIDSVIGAFGHLLGRTFVLDPRVRGKITLETPRPVTRAQAYALLQSQLRLQGIAIVESGPNLARVVPEADAKLQPSPVGITRIPGRGEEILTQIFRLNYESASNLVPVLRPLISPNNTIAAYPNNNSLIITDYASNLERMARIIATLDTPSENEIELVTVKNALAGDIAVVVSRMLDDTTRASAGAQVDAGQRISILSEPRTNSIMLRSASPSKMNLAKSLIARLDQPSAQPGNVHVVYLRNAEAVRLAEVLREVLSGQGAAGGASRGAGAVSGAGARARTAAQAAGSAAGAAGTAATSQLAAPGSSLQVPDAFEAGGAVIAADPATNSLLITAPEPVYRDLRAVIDKLDARRAQVYIESLIVELMAETAAEIGVQWQLLSGIDESVSSTRVFGGTNLPARGTGAN
ncbi:MAG: type II secretion system secretin GspD, partial [Burkholderiales bacterium]